MVNDKLILALCLVASSVLWNAANTNALQLPVDLIKFANFNSHKFVFYCKDKSPCSDFQIDCASRFKVKNGEEYNGITEKYRIGYSYVYYDKYHRKYYDINENAILYKLNGEWQWDSIQHGNICR